MELTKAKSLLGFVALTLLLYTAMPVVGTEHDEEAGRASIIRVAPSPPVFDEKARHAELAERRARVGQAVGPKGILILFSSEPRVYSNDVYYEYRQENNLYYLTNLKNNGATLILLPGNPTLPEILFLPRRNPWTEIWNGRMYSAEEASQISGIEEIWEASEFEPFLRALRSRQPYRPKAENILLSSRSVSAESVAASAFAMLFAAAEKNDAGIHLLVTSASENPEYRNEQRFASDWVRLPSGYGIRNASQIFSGLRQRKSPMEIALTQHAIDITIEAVQRAWVAAAEAKWEYEVVAQVAFTFKLRNAELGFPSIVGSGPNTTTLHYDESQGAVKQGDLLLMDVGAEYDHYSADVTRTIPVNGKFSPAQADIYQIVYDAQEAGAKAARPGALVSDIDRAATEVIKDGLLRLGLITDRNSNQFRTWFMHGTSHWLGMNVHDVGDFGRKLEPGMVFTNEPGIYVRLDALDNLPKNPENEKFIAAVRPAFEKYKGIGVRIEDDMLITPDGVKWMTEALPRKISDIEAFIARARRGAGR